MALCTPSARAADQPNAVRSWLRRVALGTVAAAAAAAAIGFGTAGTAAAATGPYGPDVASYQHPNGAAINWGQVAGETDQQFAIIKATEGTSYTNPYLSSDAAQAAANGLHVGYYHFAHPGSSAIAQADYFASTIGPLGASNLAPILDLEITGQCGSSPCGTSYLQTWTAQFLQRVQADTGRVPMIYTDPSFWNGAMGGSTAFGNYPLWLADYTGNPFGQPNAWPNGWSSFALWQYTDNASIPGIQTTTDRSVAGAPLVAAAAAPPSAVSTPTGNGMSAAQATAFLQAIVRDTTAGGALPANEYNTMLAKLENGQLTQAAIADTQVHSASFDQRTVEADYQRVLNRAVDPSGLATWTNQLEHGMTPAALFASLAASGEFYQHEGGGTQAGFLTAAYRHLLARTIDPGGLQTWSNALNHGMSRSTLALGLIQSGEGRIDQVNAAFQMVLHRAADPSGLATWTMVLAHNGGNTITLDQDLFSSGEYLADTAK